MIPNEITFTRALLIALSHLPGTRVWRQDCGSIPVRDARGRVIRHFDAGPPEGAADISGITTRGRRLEIELKMPGGKLREGQRAWARMVTELGGVYLHVQYNPDLDLDGNVCRAVDHIAEAIAQ